jgi:hypothetical protein
MTSHGDEYEEPDMMSVFWSIMFFVGFAIFCFGITVWLIGLAIRILIWLFQLGLLIVWGGIKVYEWMQRRRRPQVIEGEILPPLAHEGSDGNRIRISYRVGD